MAAILLGVDTVRATVDDKWTLYGEMLRARSEGTTSGDRERLGGRYDWNLTPRVFSLASLDGERDSVAALGHRISLAAGLGYKFFDRDDLHFSVLGGLGYADDRYLVPREAGGELRTRFSRAPGTGLKRADTLLTTGIAVKFE